MLTDIFEKVLALFGGKDDGNKNKKLIKEIKKGLKKNSKFYNIKKDEATTSMAGFFYNIYKAVSPYSGMLDNLETSKEFKKMIIESRMSEKQLAAVERLTIEAINKRLKGSKNVKKCASELQKEIISLVSSFSTDLTNQINDTFRLIQIFKELSCYNYYFMLKKFDSRLPNQDFKYKPSFSDINATYVGEDLKDFLVVLEIAEFNANWKDVFSVLATYKSNMTMDIKNWNKLVRSIQDVKSSKILLDIVKIIDENPSYVASGSIEEIFIVEDYIKAIRDDAENAVKNILKQKKDLAVTKYVDVIFGDASNIERSKYYTNHANITYEKKGLEGYTHVDAINFLRAYYLDYFKTETKAVIEILLIQGQWATHVASQEFSEAFHQIQEYLPKSIELDNSLADDAPIGGRIKSMLRKSGKDSIAKNSLDSEIKTVNAQAKDIANNSAKHLVTLGNIIKSILEEFKAGKVESIMNWKELQATQEEPLEEDLLKTYKKLFYMVQLIQQSLKEV